jgi:hypothetical protein
VIFIKPHWNACQPANIRSSTFFVSSHNPQIYKNHDCKLILSEPVSNYIIHSNSQTWYYNRRLLHICWLSALCIKHKTSEAMRYWSQPPIHCTVSMFVNLKHSKFWLFVISSFHTAVFTFHDLQVCFPDFPVTAHITRSSVKLSFFKWSPLLLVLLYLQNVFVFD